MEFFTLITQVSSQSDHSDTCTSQARKDELILAYGRKCLEKKWAATSATHESSDLTHYSRRLCIRELCFKNSADWLTATRE